MISIRCCPSFIFLLIVLMTFSFPVAPIAQEPPYGLQEQVPLLGVNISGTPEPLPAIQAVPVFKFSRFNRPLLLKPFGNSTTHLVVVEQGGTIWVFENNPDVTERTNFLDLRRKVSRRGNEEGLLGLAFHPNYEQNGYFYVYYSASNPRRSVLSRFQVSDQNTFEANPDSEQILMEISQPAGNHNGGVLEFGPDGYLYIGLGDGGGANDQFGNGQNLNTLKGSILRIDVDNGEPYAIPDDNPFAGKEGRDEIWAYGLRNPWRFTFDSLTGDLWCGDVGQNQWEEVDLILKGGNYGWNIREGSHPFRAQGVDQDVLDSLIDPIVEYNHSLGQSITGGYVYRGSKIQSLIGAYLYADFVTGNIWAMRYDGEQVTENERLFIGPDLISSFGIDAEGEIYICSFDGQIYAIEPNTESPEPSNFPTLLSKTGLFESTEDLIPNPGMIPYSVNTPLWADNAKKTRWMAIPNGKPIIFKETGAWEFLSGTIIVKHFSINLEEGNDATDHRLETRLLIQSNGEWRGYTYMWNEEQTDAQLLDGAVEKTLTIANPSTNTTREQKYYIPSRSDCLKCHTSAAGFVLGLRTPQMNKDHQYGDITDNQLRSLNHIEMFHEPLSKTPDEYLKYYSLDNQSASLYERSNSYMAANCAFCHQPNGPGNAGIDLRFHTPLAEKNIHDVPPSQGDIGIKNALLIASGNPAKSVLLQRMIRVDNTRMPPLASSVPHVEALEVIRDWILSLGTNVHRWSEY